MSMNDLPDILTVKEVAKYMKISPLTLKRWGKRGDFIPAFRINSRGDRRYKKEDLIAFIEKGGGKK